MTSDRSPPTSNFRLGLMEISTIKTIMTEMKSPRFDFVPVSCKRGSSAFDKLVLHPEMFARQIKVLKCAC